MKKSWIFDALVGLILTLGVAVCYALPGVFPYIEGLELKSYDARAKLRQAVDVSRETVIVAIDGASIAEFGRWPWSRSRVAALLDKIEAGHPKVVGLEVVYSEPERNTGLSALDGLQKQYDELVRKRRIFDRRKLFDAAFENARVELDADSKLLASLQKAGNVVLPMFFSDGVIGAKPQLLPAVFSSSTIHAELALGAPRLAALQDKQAVFPILPFAQAAEAIGDVDLHPDRDGVLRRATLVERYGDEYVPSFDLQLAMAYLGVKPSDVAIAPGRDVRLGRAEVPLVSGARMLVTFNGPYGTFHYLSSQDVMGDKVAPDLFKDKIVIVAPTATGISTLSVTPLSSTLPGAEVAANVVENILHRKFLKRPPWARRAELGLIAFIGLFIMFALPRLKALWGFFVSCLLLAILLGAGTYLFVNGQWLKVAYPSVLLALGYLAVVSKSFLGKGQGKVRVEDEDAAQKTAALKPAAEGAVLIAAGAAKSTFGRYEIEKELGRGAMGIVYLGRDPKINRQVAIKTMILDEGSDAAEGKAVKERFFREAESAGTLNHPNIVRIFDAGEEQDVAYIAMELLDGQDFMRFTSREGLLPAAKAMEYAAVVADALDYAHGQGIVHRDIKPANLMLLKDGTVRVADFGIARITASSKTATGTVMGTPSYMSPEQVAGKKVDGRSDLFSLCVVLFELLTGEKPFKGGEGIGTLLFQIANDPHPEARSINPAVPACAAAILDKGLAKDPDQRYARGRELAADLRACAAGAGRAPAPLEAAQPPSPPAVADAAQPIPVVRVPEPAQATLRTIEIPLPEAEPTIRLTPPEAPK